jgi:hypothetical protein
MEPLPTFISGYAKMDFMGRKTQYRKKEIDVTGLPDAAVRVVQSVVSLLRGRPADTSAATEKPTDELLGLFRDEPELLDQIVQDAMSAREKQPLRLPRE